MRIFLAFAHLFTHPVHIAIQLPHSTLLFKCHTLIFLSATHLHVGTHCLQVPHF